jgi:hypothetical protein
MSEPATNHDRLASTASRIGLGIILLAGLVLGLLISAAVIIWVFLRKQDLQSVALDVVIVFGLIVPCAGFLGFALWSHPKRLLRRLAIGLSTGIGLAGVSLLGWGVWTGFDPSGMRQGEIDSALEEITSTNREAFYLGDEADRKHLAVISELDGILEFEYGRCMDNAEEPPCTRPLSVSSQPTKNWGSRGESSDCKRLRPVLGVPAANMGELTVFTGSSIVGISYLKVVRNGFVGAPSRDAALAHQLRAVGQPTAAKTLPPPDPDTQAFVDQHCGPEPE